MLSSVQILNCSKKKIIRIYGKRWQIEVFFKTCKSYLQLISEYHSLSYDALTAHVAIVFTRYLMISMEQRRSKDDRTLGEIFYFFTDELEDITFGESFQIIITVMIESISAIFSANRRTTCNVHRDVCWSASGIYP